MKTPLAQGGRVPEPSAGEREGAPLARKEPSAGEREGVPLARNLLATDQMPCQVSNVAPYGTAESRQCATAQSRRAFTVVSVGGS